MIPDTSDWKRLPWDEMVEYVIGSRQFTAAFEDVRDAVERQGIGSPEACTRVLSMIGQSAFHRARVSQVVHDIITDSMTLSGQELTDAVLKDIQMIISVYTVIGAVAGVQTTSGIIPDSVLGDQHVQ